MAKVKPITKKSYTDIIGDSGHCIDPFAKVVIEEAVGYCLDMANKKLESIHKIFPRLGTLQTAHTLGLIGVINETLKGMPACKPEQLAQLDPDWKPTKPAQTAKPPRPEMVPGKKKEAEVTTQVEKPKSERSEKPKEPPTPDWMPKGEFSIIRDLTGKITGSGDERGMYWPPDLKKETVEKILNRIKLPEAEQSQLLEAWVQHYLAVSEAKTETKPTTLSGNTPIYVPNPLQGQDVGSISPEEETITALQNLINPDKKSNSIDKIEDYISKHDITDEEIEGIEDVLSAIEDYRAIEKSGQTPEEYAQAKEDAYQEITDKIEDLQPVEKEDAEEEPVPAVEENKFIRRPGTFKLNEYQVEPTDAILQIKSELGWEDFITLKEQSDADGALDVLKRGWHREGMKPANPEDFRIRLVPATSSGRETVFIYPEVLALPEPNFAQKTANIPEAGEAKSERTLKRKGMKKLSSKPITVQTQVSGSGAAAAPGDFAVKLLFPGDTEATEIRITSDPAKVDKDAVPPVWLNSVELAQMILAKKPGETVSTGTGKNINTILIREIKKL